ncbi:MAG: hypothetical protein RLY86_3290 [Pseudomonadota bacterium]|jgi:hypothetical protein
MSLRAVALVIPHPLPAKEKAVLVSLANAADDDGTNAYPSIARLVEETGLGKRTVQEGLRDLEARGLIRCTREADASNRRPRTYAISLDKLKGCGSRTGADTAQVREPHERGAAAAHDSVLYPVHKEGREAPAKSAQRRTAIGVTVLPPNWRAHAAGKWSEWCRATGNPEPDPDTEFDRFRDHHLSRGTLAADWFATWRTWVRNHMTFADNRKGKAHAHGRDAARSAKRGQAVAALDFLASLGPDAGDT